MSSATASKFAFTFVIATALVCLPGSAFAQRGGGHFGGGGFHGGGFHGGGGGFHAPASGGGIRSYSGGSVAGGSYRPGGSVSRSYSSPSRPAANSYRPGTGSGSYRPPTSGLAGSAQVARDGQWHSFGARNSVAGTFAAGPGFAGSAGFVGGAGFNRGGLGFRPGLPVGRPVIGLGFPAVRARLGFGGFGWGWGGWGWGLGFGFGWGPCWGAAWLWDPFCFDSFAAWPAYPAYGYYAYPPYAPYPYDPDAYPPTVGYDPNYAPGYSLGPNSSASPNSSIYAPTSPANPNWDTSVNAATSVTPPPVPVVIYLKDGTSLLPSDYWIVDNTFHYVLGGEEFTVDLGRVDLKRTNDANYKAGATFWLKSAPDTNPGSTGVFPQASPAPAQDHNIAPVPAATPPAAHDPAVTL